MNEQEKMGVTKSIKDDIITILNVYVIPKSQKDIYLKCLNVDFRNILEQYRKNKLIYDYEYMIRCNDSILDMNIVVVHSPSVTEVNHYIDLQIELTENRKKDVENKD